MTVPPAARRLYYAGADKKPIGPVDEASLRALHLAGTVADRTWVIEEGGKEWLSYARFFTPLPSVPAIDDEEGDGATDESRPALLLKRIATAAVLALPFTFAVLVLLVAVGGGIVGARQTAAAPPADSHAAYEAGRAAGVAFGQKYAAPLFLASLATGTAAAAALAFSNILPWCRRKRR